MDTPNTYHKNVNNLIGQRFGRLLVTGRASLPGELLRWTCLCDCGNVKSVRSNKLPNGNTVSCGCHVAEQRQKFNLSRTDFTGQVFGKLTVTGRVWVDGKMQWACKCECGNERTAITNYLKASKNPSCGCERYAGAADRRFVDMMGQRFGKLLVAEFTGFDEKRKSMWRCVCDCGGERITRGNTLKSGRAISCGCAADDDAVYMPEPELQRNAIRTSVRRARKRAAGGSFTAEQLQEVFSRQRYLCANCGKKLKLVGDHKVPLSKGGSNDISNMEVLCNPCNHRKNAKDPIAWAQENGRLL